jgi:NAD(P)-dependent dehydrogenase (short-subunit alcohol dehydrogenase family)
MTWTIRNIAPQAGRRALITGGNSGIGFQTALELARCGVEVILPTRTEVKSAEAVRRIQAEVPNAKLIPAILDLSSLKSIHAFAQFYAERFSDQSLDLLINNAGVMNLPSREVTVDGFERQFATNYLGPFALTALLFPHLKQQYGTRIVTVSSIVAHQAKIDFDNLQSERIYKSIYGTYSQTKLADLIFALELQRRLSAVSSPIISVAAHPGTAVTNIQGYMTGFFKMLGSALTPITAQSAEQGALPILFAALSPDVVPGGYYGPDGHFELKGYPTPAKIPSVAIDATVAKQLWEKTEQLTGVIFNPTFAL